MTIVGGFDVHSAQITFDLLDSETGEVRGGQIRPATRSSLRKWLKELDASEANFALEGCTGWRFVAQELQAAGYGVHVAEPADTATLRGTKKRAKTDRADARHLRQLLWESRLPESWVPPRHVLETRTLGRLYMAVLGEQHAWQQRIHAQLFHQDCPAISSLLSQAGRAQLGKARLSPAGRTVVEVALLSTTTSWTRRRPCGPSSTRLPPAKWDLGPS